MVSASHCVGLTFPGMIDDPGSFSGSEISPSPERGPEARKRISLAIFITATASVLSAPEKKLFSLLYKEKKNYFCGMVKNFFFFFLPFFFFFYHHQKNFSSTCL